MHQTFWQLTATCASGIIEFCVPALWSILCTWYSILKQGQMSSTDLISITQQLLDRSYVSHSYLRSPCTYVQCMYASGMLCVHATGHTVCTYCTHVCMNTNPSCTICMYSTCTYVNTTLCIHIGTCVSIRMSHILTHG